MPDVWDEDQFHTDKTEYGPQNETQKSFAIRGQDTLNPQVFEGSMSRPPSRVSNRGTGNNATAQGANRQLSLKEQEDEQMQKAIDLSMSQTLPGQESGVTENTRPHFGPATRDYHDTKHWTMTVSGSHAQEILVNPDPGNRKREPGGPAFIKPLPGNSYLPALITILHAIPMAREALLLRDYLLDDYGNSDEWWDGVQVQAPKIVTIDHAPEQLESDDVIFESQRLMAFLDLTDRAYGSAAVLANLEGIRNSGGQETGFLDSWHVAAARCSPETVSRSLFESIAYKAVPGFLDESNAEPFRSISLLVDRTTAGQSLYEAFDDALWAHNDIDDPEHSFVEQIADVFTIHVHRQESDLAGLKVPAVWYPDRYMKESLDIAREMRTRKAAVKEVFEKAHQAQTKLKQFMPSMGQQKTVETHNLMRAAISHFSIESETHKSRDGDEELLLDGQPDVPAYHRVARELKAVSERISQKVEDLETTKNQCLDEMHKLSQLYTKPAEDPDLPPHRRFTLRGVATDSHITYVLEKSTVEVSDDLLSTGATDWQWWKIHYEGVGTYPISYEKVREIEVLKAAKDESRTTLLVYASDNAVLHESRDLPDQLRNFVRADNLAFAAELERPLSPKSTTPTKRKALDDDDDQDNINWGGYQDPGPPRADQAHHSNTIPPPPPYERSQAPAPPPRSSLPRKAVNKSRSVPSYDDTIPISLQAEDSGVDLHLEDSEDCDDAQSGQEMQERGGGFGVVPQTGLQSSGYTLGDYTPEISMEDPEDEGKEKAD